jgi:hypothetical protein
MRPESSALTRTGSGCATRVESLNEVQRSNVRKHVRILGWLQIILGIIDLLIGLTAFGLLSGIGIFSGMASGEVVPFGIMAMLGAAAGTFMLHPSVPQSRSTPSGSPGSSTTREAKPARHEMIGLMQPLSLR